MYRRLLLVFIGVSFALACSTPPKEESISQNKDQAAEQSDPIPVADSLTDSVKIEVQSIPKVLIVPCSNGYEYHMHAGVVNTSLEKYLAQDERIEVLSFPYIEMKGAGYFGVYDKKHCKSILDHTDADFLVMTRMIGGLVPIILQEQDLAATQNWGYSTKILNREKMKQFNGISAKNLAEFEEIDLNVKRKVSDLADSILASHGSEP
jgi:hypothetical protein